MLGLIGKKVGMTQIFSPTGELIPVTVIQAGPCTVLQTKTAATDGYVAVQLGFAAQKPQRVPKPYRQHCLKAGHGVFAVIREFLPRNDHAYAVGEEVTLASNFKAGDRVDVSGMTKGRGYTGVIKRHRFGGFPSSHGTHECFRHGGSIGNRSYPGRVFKGTRMAGQYGADRVTTQNLEVVAVRPDEHLLLVRGCVPGARGGVVIIQPAVKGQRRD
ncbi:MAG: 50S ribosomal protein L3 [Candidatus Binatia bacterium]